MVCDDEMEMNMPRVESGRQKGRPAKPRELDSTTVAPEPPQGLGSTGLRVWYDTWLHCGSWVSPADAHLVETYARLSDETELLRAAVASGAIPRWYKSGGGSLVQHPALKQLSDLRRSLTTAMSQLGLTPADRARMQADESGSNIAEDLRAAMEGARARRTGS